jgi:hypothetical protein
MVAPLLLGRLTQTETERVSRGATTARETSPVLETGGSAAAARRLPLAAK